MHNDIIALMKYLADLEKYFKQAYSGKLDLVSALALQSLELNDGQMAGALADSVQREHTAFTPVIDRLEKAGYVERRKNEHDRRSILIFLTTLGRSKLSEIESAICIAQSKAGKKEE